MNSKNIKIFLDDECPICLTEFKELGKDEPIAITQPCHHCFCAECFKLIIKQKLPCPKCRSKMTDPSYSFYDMLKLIVENKENQKCLFTKKTEKSLRAVKNIEKRRALAVITLRSALEKGKMTKLSIDEEGILFMNGENCGNINQLKTKNILGSKNKLILKNNKTKIELKKGSAIDYLHLTDDTCTFRGKNVKMISNNKYGNVTQIVEGGSGNMLIGGNCVKITGGNNHTIVGADHLDVTDGNNLTIAGRYLKKWPSTTADDTDEDYTDSDSD
jgi:hypothetical protein